MLIDTIEYIFAALGIAVGLYASLRFIHMLQLESYQPKMFLKWLRRNVWRDWLPTILIFIICTLFEVAISFSRGLLNDTYQLAVQIAVRLIYLLLLGYIGHSWQKQPTKKPLIYTNRIRRLLLAVVLIMILINIYPLAMTSVYNVSSEIYIIVKIFVRIGLYLPALLLPLIVLAAYFITSPIEHANNRRYFNDAQSILKNREDLIKIGITGSCGKTSVKYILGTLLKEKYNTLITPHSYNTPMGTTRVIREMLSPNTEVFVAEMGARYIGDIEELCELVSPRIGILTAVGKQHMETFGCQENIANTKFELIAALPQNGAAFFNADNTICHALYARSIVVKNKFLYGIDSRDELYMRATDISVSPQGSVFTLITQSGDFIECRTRLLGRHNIVNITAGAAVSYYLGLTLERIAYGIKNLEPVEHRLQLIPGIVTTIDDAFNSNPDGARAAMEVLRSFDGRKIVVTPGMVELGEEEAIQNEDFGAEMACSADFVILVGKKRAVPIIRGMEKLNFPSENIFTVGSLDEATAVLSHLTIPGDVVIFENDLPDNYTE